jgi:K+:H+ antiporter
MSTLSDALTHHELVLRMFLQLAVILVACRVVGLLGRRLGQTQVVSEMVAGVLLGPSLFGLFAPQAQQWLFPREGVSGMPHPSMSVLFAISQVGLVLYMFLVGLDFKAALIMGRARSAALVSGAGIVVPLALGGALGLIIHEQGEFFAAGIGPWPAALYLGASMSITAFPMLARIILERGIAGTRLGTLTLAAGAMDDAVAWCLLAVVLSVVSGSLWMAIVTIGGAMFYMLAMIGLGRPAFRFFTRWTEREGGITPSILASTLAILMLAAWFTDVIGIYAVFGAFVCGAVMPRGGFAEELQNRLGSVTSTLLLPVFFVFSGLNTRIGLVNTPRLWIMTGVIVLIAIAGKGLACMLAARAGGENWRLSATIGVLMNARGLMELIILNIGLQRGIITPTLFTMMVLMAVVTTLMASPLFSVFYRGRSVAA